MLLPTELLALVLLATSSTAFPQNGQLTNATAPATVTTPVTVDNPDINVDPGSEECERCAPLRVIPALSSAQGFEDSPQPTPTPFMPEEKPPQILTTRTPTIIDIQVNTAAPPPAPSGDGNGGSGSNGNANQNQNQPQNDRNNNPPPAPLPTTIYSVRMPNAPSSPTQAPAENALLRDIISRINDAEGQAQPGAAQPPGPMITGNIQTPVLMEQATPGPKAQSIAAIAVANPQAPLAAGGMLTAGSATLTLTPGLSTTIGGGSAATYIGITTDSAGQTLITISSSGTAVTARVTNAPATVTLPESGFYASITQVAGPADSKPSNVGGSAAPSTTSKGAAEPGTRVMSWQMKLAAGVVALVGALW